jgi:hypothetical protein
MLLEQKYNYIGWLSSRASGHHFALTRMVMIKKTKIQRNWNTYPLLVVLKNEAVVLENSLAVP